MRCNANLHWDVRSIIKVRLISSVRMNPSTDVILDSTFLHLVVVVNFSLVIIKLMLSWGFQLRYYDVFWRSWYSFFVIEGDSIIFLYRDMLRWHVDSFLYLYFIWVYVFASDELNLHTFSKYIINIAVIVIFCHYIVWLKIRYPLAFTEGCHGFCNLLLLKDKEVKKRVSCVAILIFTCTYS